MWGLAWLPIGIALALYADSQPPQPSDLLARPVSIPFFVAAWTVWGAISGAVFALVLALTERRGTVETLSAARTALHGAIAAVSLPLLLTGIDLVRTSPGLLGYSWRFPLLILIGSAGAGAACATATLRLARRTVP